MNQTEQKKAAILQTTFQLLNEKEIKDITVDEIAQKASVSKVTLFKYFQNKNHLMNLVILKAFEHMTSDIEQIIKSELNFDATYQAINQMKLAQLQRYSKTFSNNLMTQYAESPDFYDQDTLSLQAQVYQDLFEKGQKEGKISLDFSHQDFMFIISLFNEGMKAFNADVLFSQSDLISRFFINGLK
ncbi:MULTISPECIES: TetR/AcrR family transcriptional regulator [unclassified Lactococcus]|uniref:TetR/AcrR family transcriptional regulator n=1 Tax=unclassified Lactococcus TaxID=2643510 RepID=UPI0011CA48BF|nr:MULTISPECIES: TetR/AcrR family transcriptional regulator [unclassified Lactococcus]MQW23817.1 TetR family transcriptional regulator [Lactococcus sp. dk101]TXK37359.1 TetR/AcrR family transcriptional regulator [Lactococcus sp. dk310]TXK48670.1 TetR/AcrR family transcriptional regulator [Lactococcus sp. dk322]